MNPAVAQAMDRPQPRDNHSPYAEDPKIRSLLPRVPVPIQVRAAGVRTVKRNRSWQDADTPAALQILWGSAGRGQLTVGGATAGFGPSDVAFKAPGERLRGVAETDVWELNWVTFEGPGAAAFLESYAYPKLIRNAGACPQHLFAEMEAGLRDAGQFRQRKLVSVITEILALAGGPDDEPAQTGWMVNRFVELAREKYANPSLNVAMLADTIGVHRTTLTRLFKTRMRVSPGEYLTRVRMQHALLMLRGSDVPIAEIADRVGVPDPTYFSRWVKRITGLGPREYRNGGRGPGCECRIAS